MANRERIAEYYVTNRERIAEYRAANRERIAAYNAEYRAANRERIAERRAANRERNTETKAKWRAANPERVVEQYAADRERRAVYFAEYHVTHPEVSRAAARRRRARKRANGVYPYDEAEVFAASNYTCVYCGAEAEEVEHFTAIANGGADAPWNVVATCVACNRGRGGKHSREPLEFLASRGVRFARVVRETRYGALRVLMYERAA